MAQDCSTDKNRTNWIETILNTLNVCPICGGHDFSYREVLWQELVSDWQLSLFEVNYINRQQGLNCVRCGNNLRSMALADALLCSFKYRGPLVKFVESDLAKTLNVLEINEAGGLSSVLEKLPNHQLVRYPEYDMTRLAFESATFDLVLHSDTLEHVPNPVAGLSECRRILTKNGRCIFTVPIIIGRLTRSRAGLKNSHHGATNQLGVDYIVHTEFGADMWKFALEAGFTSTRIHCLEYPSALAIEATTNNEQ
ncbi:MAG: methyltransferase domain-containing protein [Nitrosomonadales bacterium]|nr:methyltransferase domain-containing protein [Nitrosomonadales bacterium]